MVIYLSLISDEIYFWFRWLGRRRRGNGNLWSFIRFLHQHINEGFLFWWWCNVWNFRHLWWRWSWSFDEHNLVMFLWWWRWGDWPFWSIISWFRRWNVYIHMFVHYCWLSWWAVLWSGPITVRSSIIVRNRSCITI